jgi:hypothetical protein
MEQAGRGGLFDPYDDDDDAVFGGDAVGPDMFNIFDKLMDLFSRALDDDDDPDDFVPFPPPPRRKKAKKRRR